MWWRNQLVGQPVALIGLIGVALVVFILHIASAWGPGISLPLAPVYLLAYIFAIVVLPLMLFALLKFAYSVFARPYLRLWRLRRFRDGKYLREAIKRGP